MVLIQCDECDNAVPAEDATEKNGWHHNGDYDFDACSQACYEKLCAKHYGEEE
jgi:hypothetical protein